MRYLLLVSGGEAVWFFVFLYMHSASLYKEVAAEMTDVTLQQKKYLDL